MAHINNKTFNNKYTFSSLTYELANMNNNKKLVNRHQISYFTNDGCWVCSKYDWNKNNYFNRPTTATFYIFGEESKICKNISDCSIYLFVKKGKWSCNDYGNCGATEYESDSDIISLNPNHCHTRGQEPKIFSIERNNLQELKSFCEDHKNHISTSFKEFLEKHFPIKF